MKKAALLFASVILLSACKQTTPPTSPSDSSTPQSDSGSNSDFSNAVAAMSSGKPVLCTLSKKDGTSTMQYEMKDKKMRISGMQSASGDKTQNIISDTEYMYSWDDSTKKGMKLKLTSMEDMKKSVEEKGQSVPSLTTDEDRKKYEDQGYTVNCSVKAIDDSEFVPPTDVTFTDTSAMMEQSKAMMQKAQSSMSPQTQEEMQKQAEEMMKKYQQ